MDIKYFVFVFILLFRAPLVFSAVTGNPEVADGDKAYYIADTLSKNQRLTNQIWV